MATTIRVTCGDCEVAYDQRRKGGGVFPPRCCGHCGSKNIRVTSAANIAYQERAQETALLIGALQHAVALHKESQGSDQGNWGFNGDLAEANSRLRDLVTFLGGDPDVADSAYGMSAAVTASMTSVKP